MARFFNTTGPCDPAEHYFLPPRARLRGAELERYVRQKLYWVLHAPRQTGKTTFLMTWMKELNARAAAVNESARATAAGAAAASASASASASAAVSLSCFVGPF